MNLLPLLRNLQQKFLALLHLQNEKCEDISTRVEDYRSDRSHCNAQSDINSGSEVHLSSHIIKPEKNSNVDYLERLKNDNAFLREELATNIEKVVDSCCEFYQCIPKYYVRNYIEHIKEEHSENPLAMLYVESELGGPLNQIQLINALQQCGYTVANKSVLDIGCSNGALLLACYQLGAKKLIGVDIDSSRLQSAKKLIGNKPIEVLPIDICTQDLPETSRSFEAIFSTDVLEHVTAAQDVFLKIKNYLSNSSKENFAYISVYNKYYFNNILSEPHYSIPGLILLSQDNAREIWHKLRCHYNSQLEYEVCEWFTFWEYQAMAHKAGLVVEPFVNSDYINSLDMREESYQRSIESLCDAVNQGIADLPLSERDKGKIAEVITRYRDEFMRDHAGVEPSFESKSYIYMKYYAQPLQMIIRHAS